MIEATVLLDIASQFTIDQAIFEIKPLGNGLINDTFLVTAPSCTFVLQRINSRVFPEPQHIMANMKTLDHHVKQKSQGSVRLQIPELLLTQSGKTYTRDEAGEYWRAMSFIGHTESLERLRGLGDAQQTGFALGHFHALVCDLAPSSIKDTLPGFHITPDYLSHYQELIRSLPEPATPESLFCAEFIDSHQYMADDLEAAKKKGHLPVRVIHGDPKLNNFLFDKRSKKIVSIIDLDTVKPGLVHFDIGDCLRSCCQLTNPVRFDLELCRVILDSYLSEAGRFFSEQDYRSLYPAIRLIPFELGLRFYTDYLEGNRYFKVTGRDQNLKRSVEQFHLCESIMAQESAIKSLVAQLQKRQGAGLSKA